MDWVGLGHRVDGLDWIGCRKLDPRPTLVYQSESNVTDDNDTSKNVVHHSVGYPRSSLSNNPNHSNDIQHLRETVAVLQNNSSSTYRFIISPMLTLRLMVDVM